MTNEELVTLIQGGDRGKLVELWSQVRRLVLKNARRWAGLGGTEVADLLPEPAAEAELEAVGNRDFADRRRVAVEAAINSLPEAERDAVRRKYYRNEPVDFLAHAKALRMLRHPSRSWALWEYW